MYTVKIKNFISLYIGSKVLGNSFLKQGNIKYGQAKTHELFLTLNLITGNSFFF